MKTGFDQVAAVRAWLDEIATLAHQRYQVEVRANATTALYLWYEPSKPGKWGRFAVAPDGCAPAGFKLAMNERLAGNVWLHIRACLSRLDILNPDDMTTRPPEAELWNGTEPAAATAPTKAEPLNHPESVVVTCEHPTKQAAFEF
jgi:hypothetical protein